MFCRSCCAEYCVYTAGCVIGRRASELERFSNRSLQEAGIIVSNICTHRRRETERVPSLPDICAVTGKASSTGIATLMSVASWLAALW